jgi:holin-like protein
MNIIQIIHFMHGATGNTVPDVTMHPSPRNLLHSTLLASAAAQIGLVTLFWLGGCGVARLTGVPLPGSLLGLLALLMLLATGRLDARLLDRGAGWLLREMLLFFVPAVVALMAHPEFLGVVGLKVLGVILASTLLVMLATALTVDLGMRWMSPHARPLAVLE